MTSQQSERDLRRSELNALSAKLGVPAGCTLTISLEDVSDEWMTAEIYFDCASDAMRWLKESVYASPQASLPCASTWLPVSGSRKRATPNGTT
jgi:hypothetical protein